MASWKKVIVSGSNAELAEISASVGANLATLELGTALAVSEGGTGATALADKSVLISQDSGTDQVSTVDLSTNGQIVVGGTSGPAAATITSNNGKPSKSGSIKVTSGDGTLDLALDSNTIGVGSISASNAAAPGNVLKVSTDGNYFTFGSAASGDVTAVVTPNNSGLSISDTSDSDGKVAITMSIDSLSQVTTLAATDTFAFHDASSTDVVKTKKIPFTNLTGSIISSINAGDVTVNENGTATIQADSVEGSMLSSNVAGKGLVQGVSNALSMSINDLDAGSVSTANDAIAFNDSNGNITKKQTIDDFMNIQAGGGITTSSGQFQVHLFTTNPGLELSDENGLSKLRLKSTIGGNKTFSGNLTVQGNTTLGNGSDDTVTINGDLSVAGTASFNNATNLSVADKYILLSSGSETAGDGGIVIQQAAGGVGELFGFDSSANRFGITGSFDADTAANFAPDAFLSMVVSGSSGQNTPDVAPDRYKQAGNIFAAANGDIYIYST